MIPIRTDIEKRPEPVPAGRLQREATIEEIARMNRIMSYWLRRMNKSEISERGSL